MSIKAFRASMRHLAALTACAGAVLIPGVAVAQVGNPASGEQVYQFETFGNERFWTDAVRLPQGMMAAGFTPLDALELGLQVDADALPFAVQLALAQELRTDRSRRRAPLINNSKVMDALIDANAIIGLVAKDSNGDGRIDIRSGDKVGVSCALCHSITDGSVFQPRTQQMGSIGRRQDGRATHSIDVGGLFALGANSRALYPDLQLQMPDGSTIGRATKGLTANSTEAEVDAYFTNKHLYPRGSFDDSPDGIGNAIQNAPFFRTDLSAPYGSAGEHAFLGDFGNAVYTVLLDMTTVATPEGRAFLTIRAGAAGAKLSDDYKKILAETGVTGYPFVQATAGLKPGDPATPVGRRVDEQKLLDMNAFTNSLPAPPGARVNPVAALRGRELFLANCTSCHNVDQGVPVPSFLVPPQVIFPNYRPKVLLIRMPPQDPVQNSPGIFDDKYVVNDSSDRGTPRGNAITLLLDLDRKPQFLHDASVPSLDNLLDPSRGHGAPHSFFIAGSRQRHDVVEFLRSLGSDY